MKLHQNTVTFRQLIPPKISPPKKGSPSNAKVIWIISPPHTHLEYKPTSLYHFDLALKERSSSFQL